MKKYCILLINILFLFSCGVVEKGEQLTDTDVKNYIEVYKNLRENAPKMLENVNSDPENSQKGTENFENFEQIIKDGGIKNYQTFVLLNAKIGSIFSILQTETAVQHFDNLNESGNQNIEQAIEEINKILADPNVPESAKEAHKETLKQLQDAKKQINTEWKKNKPIADWVLEKTKKISGLIVTESDIKIVKKYEKEILEAYSGFQMPSLPNGKMPIMNPVN